MTGGPIRSRQRWLAWLAASGVAGWLLHLAWPWCTPTDDAFRGTVAILPAVAVALGWLGADAARRSGRKAQSASWLEWTLLAGVLLSLPFRHALGWSVVDGPWAAALVLALGAAVRRRLLDLRPLLVSGRAAVHFFLLPLVVYLAIQPWALESRPPDGDEPYNLLIAHSLVFDFDTDLRNQYADGDSLRFMDRELEPQTGDPVAHDGSQQSRHSPLLPALVALPYAVAGRAGAAALMAVLSALLAWTCLRLTRRLLARLDPAQGREGGRADSAAFLAWACLAFLSPLLFYAHQLWVEVPAALLLALALDRLLVDRDRDSAGETVDRSTEHRSERSVWRRRDVQVAILLAALPLFKLRFAFLSAGLLLLAALRWRSRGPGSLSRVLRLAGPGVAVAATLVAVWGWRYGNPLKLYTRGELTTLASSPWQYARGMLGLFYDCAFGLLGSAPLWALLLPGLAWLLRSAAGRRLAGRLAVVGLPYVLLVSPRLEWYGGWSPPFRYALVLLPLLVPVLACAVVRRTAGVRALLVLLGTPTLLLMLLWVVSPPWTYNLADGYSHLLQQAGALLGSDVGRFFPSLVRPRLATWLWIAASLATIPVAAWRGRPLAATSRRWAGAAGFCALLAAMALLPLATHRVPTSRVQVEDQFVTKRGGVPHPGPWRQRRPEAAAGWLIGRGHQMVVPVVAGGARAHLEIRVLRFGLGIDKLHADVLLPDGSRLKIGSWRAPRQGQWTSLEAESVDWPPGASLLLYHPGPYRDTRQGLVVNWVDFHWLD